MNSYIIINNRKYTVEGCDFIYRDGTMRLAVRTSGGVKKLAQFSADGEFEVWDTPPKGGYTKFGRAINMRK